MGLSLPCFPTLSLRVRTEGEFAHLWWGAQDREQHRQQQESMEQAQEC